MMLTLPDHPLILASASTTRLNMFKSAGVECLSHPAHIDEDSLKDAAQAEGLSARDGATMLAEMKAAKVSGLNPGAFVIGADQLLDFEGQWFSKPVSVDEAKTHLRALSGQTHDLVTAAVIYRDGERIWHHVEVPRIGIRRLDDSDIDDYLVMMGAKMYDTPGVYMMEDLGAQIINKIDGCPYSVLGLPLLQMMDFLRGHGLALKEGNR